MAFQFRRHRTEQENTVFLPDASISSGKTGPDSLVSGFWLGVDYDGTPKFTIGDADNEMKFDVVNGLRIDTQLAANSITAEMIQAGAINTNHLQADSVTTTKIIANTINSSHLQANSITSDKIIANSISATHLQANSITSDKITAEAITADHLQTNSITSDKITAEAITADHLQTNSITSDKITANSINTNHLQSDSVTTTKIAAQAITSDLIAANSITSTLIGTDAITSDKIATNAIISNHILTNAITSDKIVANAITGTHLAVDTIEAAHIKANTIETNHIQTNAINSEKIAASAVGSSELSPDSVTTNHIQVNSIVTNHLQSDIISAIHLQANSVSASTIQAGIISSSHIATNTITTAHLQADSVQTAAIQAGAIVSSHISSDSIATTHLQANSVQASNINVSTLNAISSDMGSLTAGSITIGSSNKIWLNDNGEGDLAIGGTVKATAPFKVSNTGQLTATNATINGTINATNGTITGDLSMPSGGIIGYYNGDQMYKIHSQGIDYTSGEDARELRWVKPTINDWAAMIAYTTTTSFSDFSISAQPAYTSASANVTITATNFTTNKLSYLYLNDDPKFECKVVSSNTNTTQDFTLWHGTSATRADGFGASLDFRAGTSTSTDESIGKITHKWSTINHSTRVARADLSLLGRNVISYQETAASNPHLQRKLSFFGKSLTHGPTDCAFDLYGAWERQELGPRSSVTAAQVFDVVATLVNYLKGYGLLSDL